jgi:enamine deaminase RidA (YjgF/YER057c/UK114 family)
MKKHMNKIEKFGSGARWEEIVGYSRAVKAGNMIYITGTTAVDENGEITGKGDMYKQAKYIFEKIGKYLEQAGASYDTVIRNRIYVTDISKWEEAGRAHSEVFGKIKPCCTMIGIKELVSPDMLVEIETEAMIIL